MKKKFLLAIVMVLVLILACGLAACNKNKDKGNDKPNTPDTPTACEHEYGEWIVDTEATCTTNGAKHKTCTKCGDRVDEVITATGIHDYNAITGKCLHCESDLGRTVTFDDEILGDWYIHFAPVGNKIFFNFTTIEPEYYFFILDAQQYFDEGIKEEDLDSCLVKDVKLYKDGDFENEIALTDNNYLGDNYFWWESEDYLDANTKYYVVITLDQEYDDFIFNFNSIDKEYDDLMNLNITTTAVYKIYDGNPFVVEATADEGEVRVIYFDMAVDYGTGTLTPPTEPGDYFAKIYAETETKYYGDYYEFSIIAVSQTIEVGGDDYREIYAEEGTVLETEFEAEEGKQYAIFVSNIYYWDFEVSDDDGGYGIVWNSYYDGGNTVLTARNDGHESVEYSVYDEEGNAVAEGLKAGDNFDVTVAGKYYFVVERVNDEDESIGFAVKFVE